MTAFRLAACPLRGALGETRYAHLRPTGERATESALLVPEHVTPALGWFAGCFQRFGVWTGPLTTELLAQLAGEIRGAVGVREVLADEVTGGRLLTALDSGAIVVRPGAGAHAYLTRTWVRFVVPQEIR
jgi:hypothetical protein